MSDKPIHNSGAELASRTNAELESELRGSVPGGLRWQGLTFELQQRATSRQERLIVCTFRVSLAALLVGVVGAMASIL